MFKPTFEVNKKSKNKPAVFCAVALVVLLLASAVAVLPIINAHTPAWQIPTYAYLSVAPNPAGVGQEVFVNFWLNLPPPTAAGAYGDRWKGFTVEITKPDGTNETKGPFTSDAVGGAWTTYMPATTGTYTFVFKFAGQTITGENPNPVTGNTAMTNNASIGDYYQPSTSQSVTLTVQQEQVTYAPENPLPTGYWTRPVQSTNSEWWRITGNWYGFAASTFAATGMYNASGNFNPYTTAPNTAHIVWTKPEAFGGMIGGEFGGSQQSNYYSTSQYEPKFAPIIMNGILYYTMYPGSSTYPSGWAAVDVRTGETIWTKDTDEILRTGQVVNYVSPNQYGGLAYLWAIPRTATGFAYAGSMYYSLYDAMTGDWILNIIDALPMTITEAVDGSLIGYFVNSTSRTLNMWNSTECILYPNGHISENWMWRPAQGSNISFSRGIMWSIPLPTNISGSPIVPNLGISKIASDVILMLSTPTTGSASSFFQPGWQTEAAFDAKTGKLLWGPVNRTETPWTRIYMGPAGDGVYTEYVGETMEWTGYSLTTGNKLWGPVETPHNAWSYYGMQNVLAYGNIYAFDFGGVVNCIDIQTGELEWTWNTGSSGYETPYGIWPLWTFTTGTVADNKLYVPEGHMYSPPLFHGAKQWCINTTTGEPVWNIMAFDVTSAPAIADGYMVTLNAYDNQIYCYNKGPTATTVTATPGIGNAITIQGTVTDQSPGQTAIGVPAAGTPAIADASMTDWMEYLYMQQPMPTNATGVPVTIFVSDQNNNVVYTTTTTSDISGHYGVSWTPTVQGMYTVTAAFDGTESYFASTATTGIAVGQTATQSMPTATPGGTAGPTSGATGTPAISPSAGAPGIGITTETLLIIGAAVVIVAVIAVAAVLLRRKA